MICGRTSNHFNFFPQKNQIHKICSIQKVLLKCIYNKRKQITVSKSYIFLAIIYNIHMVKNFYVQIQAAKLSFNMQMSLSSSFHLHVHFLSFLPFDFCVVVRSYRKPSFLAADSRFFTVFMTFFCSSFRVKGRASSSSASEPSLSYSSL